MDELPVTDTRARILRTALDLFAAKGYQRTSLREIADRVRLTKAAILYHFPSKEHLLGELVEPLLSDLEAALDRAARLPWPARRRVTLEGWLDTLLAHRHTLGSLYHDVTMLTRGSRHGRLIQIALRAYDLVAGPENGHLDRIRAVQAVAALSDPVVFFTDVPAERLRADMLDGAHRLLGDLPAGGARGGADRRMGHGDAVRPARRPGEEPGSGQRPADPSGRELSGAAGAGPRRRAGRPRAMSREQIDAARTMHAEGVRSVDQIAADLGVSRATLYRHLRPAGRLDSSDETIFETN
ncbi:TetR family transcriptional regulator [Plantactinospora sp. CA-290183]|uniref:TetR family transcriptional regulator n=1 Tax=Plantactinospora sp. CA-290183 TaxID=3240006 RepID=UPI003D9459E0